MIPRIDSLRRAFSVFELLVIIAVIAILIGMLVPAVQKVRETANRLTCQNNLKQITLAMHIINDTHNRIPGAIGDFPNEGSPGTYFFHILPYIEQDNLYKNAALDSGNGFSVWQNETFSKTIKLYCCPSDGSTGDRHLFHDWLATSNYAANWLVFGTTGARIPNSFPDGTSNTIVFTERFQICNDTPCAWGYSGGTEWASVFAYSSQAKFQVDPPSWLCNPAQAQSAHNGGINVSVGDGSVRFVSANLSPQTWYFACTPAGGEVLGPDW
ncbi:MAG: DUF1559 domain-containing protein [Gemmataceae bacterium]